MKANLLKIYHDFRDAMHVVGFFTLAYWFIGLLEIDFYTWQKIVLALVLSALGYAIGHAYEGIRYMFFGEPTSNSDANLSCMGFSLGSWIIIFIPNITFINVYMFYFCLIIFAIDVLWAICKKLKRKTSK
jgi:VanZ family protein